MRVMRRGADRNPLLRKVEYASTISYTLTSPAEPRPMLGTGSKGLVMPTLCAYSATLAQPTFSVSWAVTEFTERAMAARSVMLMPVYSRVTLSGFHSIGLPFST